MSAGSAARRRSWRKASGDRAAGPVASTASAPAGSAPIPNQAISGAVQPEPMSALEAAVEVARAHGLACDDAIVLREAWHVLVHLRPLPLIARVTSGSPGVDPEDVVRELAVARHLAGAGAPVVEPSDLLDPGPHAHRGHTLVFWSYLVSAGELDPASAGRGLRAIHEALADYDGELPRAGRAHDVQAMLAPLPPSSDTELLGELSARELPAGQALHGDAHLFNCLPTAGGPVWHDLETACRGPREYDLAALVLSDRSEQPDPDARTALTAYGPYDADLLELALPVYAAWIAASFLAAVARRPDAAARVEAQMRFLRRYR